MSRVTLVLAGWLVPVAASSGQTISGLAVVAAPKQSTCFSGLTERVDGFWAGGALEVETGHWNLLLRGMRGRLTPSDAGSVPRRDVGELSLRGAYRVRPWLGVELGYLARAFSSAAGYQRWDIVGVGVAASRDLGTPAVHAFARLVYRPLVTIRDGAGPDFGVGSDVGIVVEPRRLPIALMLSYQAERFSFPASAGRAEQFEALTLSVGLHARGLGGR